jgi:hypothetical protein
MHSDLSRLKLKYYINRYGEITYDEAVQLAKEAEQIATDCGPMDPAFIYFAQQVRDMWKFASVRNETENLERNEHLDRKVFLCAWTDCTWGKPKVQRTEEIVFQIPRYNRSLSEQRSYMAQDIRVRYNVLVCTDDIEFMEMEE